MASIISEILSIRVDSSSTLTSSTFEKLRQAAAKGGVKEQYYGLDMDKPNQLLWVIQWPGDSKPTKYRALREISEQPKGVGHQWDPELQYANWCVLPDLREYAMNTRHDQCFVHITSASDTPDLSHSIEKSFTDCYFAEGFLGGAVGKDLYDDKMNYYCLGWESRQLYQKYAKSELFAEEMNKLMPYIDSGHAYFIQSMMQEL